MPFKPNYKLQENRRNRIDFAARIACFEETENNKKTQQARKADSNLRTKIQNRIRELKKSGRSKEKALIILKSEFPDSQYSGFFESWIENAYTEKKWQKPFREAIEGDIEER